MEEEVEFDPTADLIASQITNRQISTLKLAMIFGGIESSRQNAAERVKTRQGAAERDTTRQNASEGVK